MRAARRAATAAVLALLALPLLPAGQASAASYRVAMQGYAFAPAALTVPVGSTVTWTNQDTAPHDVKTTSGPAMIHSPMLNKGQSWSFTFTTAGSYAYYCTVHPNMTARIVVRPAAPATSAAPAHEHHTQAPAQRPTVTTTGRRPPSGVTRTPAAPAPAASPSKPASAAAAPGAPSTPASPSMPQTQPTASSARPLDPLLVLTGIVAGIAVLCLLLVGSRAAGGREESQG